MDEARSRPRFGMVAATVVLALFGALVLVASPAAAVDVSDEDGLRAAFDTQNQIDLLNDITLDDCGAGNLNRSVSAPVTLDGHGFTITQTCPSNILNPDDSDVTIQNVTLTGGRDDDDGGAIDMNGGDLTVLDSTLVDNCSADSAGAIENEDNATTIIGSTLTDNRAVDQAGAIRSKRGDTVIVNSTITGNRQNFGGAIDSGQQNQAHLVLVYDTIVENVVDFDVICDVPNDALAESDEEADPDAEVDPASAPVTANVQALDSFASFGTVIALPINGPNCFIITPGSQGQNFSDDDTCGFTGTGDRENAGDPALGALADNGGPTQTRLPATGSPLIDWIAPATCSGGDALAGFAVTDDQRNIARPQGAGCEVGSVEIEVLAEAPADEGPIAAAPSFTG